jgi:tRNA dimethylallyltransferase
MKFEPELLRKCWFLAGPTACGKSRLALELAAALPAEIISMDSMAIYRGMDIGTAKPSVQERQQVPHHLIDVVEPDEEFSTAEFLSVAAIACEAILARGRTPLFVGGTGLYLRAVLRGVFEGPPADWDFRHRLQAEARQHPAGWLQARLAEVDPVLAGRLHENDERRLVRGLEIFHLTGVPASEQQQETPLPAELRPKAVFWLHPPRLWLADRINRRVEQMIADGLEAETRQLLQSDHPPGRTARQALGYREMLDWIAGGLPTLSATVERIQTRTRQFAKRQHTWFRNLEECQAVDIQGTETVEELCAELLRRSRE